MFAVGTTSQSRLRLFKMPFRDNFGCDFLLESKTFEVDASKEAGDEGLFSYIAESEFFNFFI